MLNLFLTLFACALLFPNKLLLSFLILRFTFPIRVHTSRKKLHCITLAPAPAPAPSWHGALLYYSKLVAYLRRNDERTHEYTDSFVPVYTCAFRVLLLSTVSSVDSRDRVLVSVKIYGCPLVSVRDTIEKNKTNKCP